ncbi:unnamed protein product [Dovyalis caffra]|uniref:Uncharacterized protein n=1 Tax=Dovyalis caffra TaxID=77055 RepID=A0AAV1SH00_9ROSI|nr:unnamed protein product [Dovyalis caffra]
MNNKFSTLNTSEINPIEEYNPDIQRPGLGPTLKSGIILQDPQTTIPETYIISAKRDKDFTGYAPFREGSTILERASIS